MMVLTHPLPEDRPQYMPLPTMKGMKSSKDSSIPSHKDRLRHPFMGFVFFMVKSSSALAGRSSPGTLLTLVISQPLLSNIVNSSAPTALHLES